MENSLSKYKVWYDAIIARACTRKKLACYCEWHHVIPRSLGGHDAPSNLVQLTYREHFLVHWLLTKIVSRGALRSMQRALMAMTLKARGRPLVEEWRVRVGILAVSDLEEDLKASANWREAKLKSKKQIHREKIEALKVENADRKLKRTSTVQEVNASLAQNQNPTKSELARMGAELLKFRGGAKAQYSGGWPIRGSAGAKESRRKYRNRQQETERNQRYGWKVDILANSNPQRINQAGSVNLSRPTNQQT